MNLAPLRIYTLIANVSNKIYYNSSSFEFKTCGAPVYNDPFIINTTQTNTTWNITFEWPSPDETCGLDIMYILVIKAQNESQVIFENLIETSFTISMDDLKSEMFFYTDEDAGMKVEVYV